MKFSTFVTFGRETSSIHASTSRGTATIASFALLTVLGFGILPACADAAAAETGSTTAMEQRLEALETKEAIREAILEFAHIVDTEDEVALEALAPKLHTDFELRVVDFVGMEHKFVGYDGLISGYGPIMVIAQANLAVSEISVKLDGDTATATFKFINSVKPPPQLGVPVNEKLLLLAANTAVFIKTNGVWQLKNMELLHSLAYPGELPVSP
jgi:hypothetical protein